MRKHRLMLALACLCLLSINSPSVLHAQNKRGITPEDYLSFRFIGDPHLSPDGKRVAYVLTTIDQKKNHRESSVWLVPADGSAAPRRVSAEGFSSNSPRWSPDGRTLAVLSARNLESSAGESPKMQIFLLSMEGGEGIALTKLKNGVQGYEWSPDGARIVVVSSSGPSDTIAPADRKSDVRHYTHMRYKFNDSGWFDDKRRHLWVVNVQSGDAKQITEGQDWNDTDPQWSPDGTRIAFVSDRTGKAYDDSDNTDVWTIPTNGGSLTKISDHLFQDESPRWAPDGKQILFTGQTARHQFPKLYVADSSGGVPSKLAVTNLDLTPTELRWPAPNSALFAAGIKGETQIFRADPSAGTFSAITSGEHGAHAFDVNESAGEMVYLASDFQHPDELFVANLNGTGEKQLTHLNSDLWSQLELQPVERLPYKSADGWAVDGFFVKPLGWQPGKKYPMVLVIHGGPEGMFGVDWYHEFQVQRRRYARLSFRS
ncbi:MAG TPA: DPP IV N-terminal domain-containing protein [Candidatus Acidoferrales bacterium]|nr:DPP IV N-terminal domain-containing protein [Candidatus Acidoferrales bacterium]